MKIIVNIYKMGQIKAKAIGESIPGRMPVKTDLSNYIKLRSKE
jgi:hypothetical protein